MQPRTKLPSTKAALPLHAQRAPDRLSKVTKSEGEKACSRGLWTANVEHMKPVQNQSVPDCVMPSFSSLMISQLRHARLQRGWRITPLLYSTLHLKYTSCICISKQRGARRSVLNAESFPTSLYKTKKIRWEKLLFSACPRFVFSSKLYSCIYFSFQLNYICLRKKGMWLYCKTHRIKAILAKDQRNMGHGLQL